MTTPFEDAFGSIDDATRAARHLDRREVAATGDHEATVTAPGGELTVTVTDAQISALDIRRGWLEGADKTEVDRVVRDTINQALKEWTEESMRRLQTATPKLEELTDMVSDARKKLRAAFDAEIQRARDL